MHRIPVRVRTARCATLAVALALALPAFAADDTFQRSVNVSSNVMLELTNGSGAVQVSASGGNTVQITGHVHANNGWSLGGSPQERVRQIVANPPVEQVGNTIRIGKVHDSSLFRNVSIDYDIKVPSQTEMNLNTGSGNLRIHGTSGQVVGHSGSGDVTVDDVHGNAKLETGSGSIRAHNLAGGANLQTGSGDIEAALTAPGDSRASTGSGSIRLSGLQGGLHADTGSGDMEVRGEPRSDWKLQTGSGSVNLYMASGSKYSIDADTGSGEIKSDQPISMKGSLNRHHVTGDINGGGPTVRIQTGSGSIHFH